MNRFLWGVATSAFQLEGSPHADWTSWDDVLSVNPDVTNHYALYQKHVDVLEKCLRDGLDVRGYFYWSLIDNYEWLQGLDARFGLYRVDFDTLERTPTNAAAYYSYLIKSRSSALTEN